MSTAATAAAADHATCHAHRDDQAGWRCAGDCKQLLCGKCTASLLELFSCGNCGGPAHRLSSPRRDKGFSHWLGVALAYPTQVFPIFAVFALLLGTIAFVNKDHDPAIDHIAAIARPVLIAIYALLVIDAAARKGNDAGTLMRAGRALLAIAGVLAPGILYTAFVGAPRSADLPILGGLGVLAAVYAPIALAVAVTDAPLGTLLNPFSMFELVWRLGRTYAATLVLVPILAAASYFLATQLPPKIEAAITAPLVGNVVSALPWLWLVTAVAAVIGLVPFVHGDRIGWGVAAEYTDALFPKMIAEGRRKIVARGEGKEGEAGAAAVADPAERAEAMKLSEALKSENPTRALRLYEARAQWSAASLDDRKLVELGRAAARVKKLELAEKLLDEAYARNGRAAGQALLALAQLNADSLGKPDKASEIYKQIVQQYPGTDMAKVATKKLDGALAS